MGVPIFIPYAKEYTVTLEGTVYKYVHCEKCAYEFAYGMSRQGEGTGTSLLFMDNAGAQSRAAQDAQRELRNKLASSCDPVPCPACGWYQQHMYPVIRDGHLMWMNYVAGVFLAAGIILALLLLTNLLDAEGRRRAPLFGVLTLIAGFVVAVLVISRKLLIRSIEPNSGDPEARKQLGEKLALRWHEFERLRKQGELLLPTPALEKTPYLAEILERKKTDDA
jgi:hypothetical protein